MYNVLKNATDVTVYATHTDYTGDCVVYEEYPTSSDKVREITRLTVNIIAGSKAKSIEIEDEIKTAVLTLGDNPLSTNVLKAELSGGGNLYDYDRQKHHRTLYFTIYRRYT